MLVHAWGHNIDITNAYFTCCCASYLSDDDSLLKISMIDEHSQKQWTRKFKNARIGDRNQLFPTDFLSHLVIEPYNSLPSFLITQCLASHLRRLTMPPLYLSDNTNPNFLFRFNHQDGSDQFSQLTTLDLQGEPASESSSYRSDEDVLYGQFVHPHWFQRFPALTSVCVYVLKKSIMVKLIDWLADTVPEQLVTLGLGNCE